MSNITTNHAITYTNTHLSDQLLVGLTAQLVEYCIGIAENRVQIPIQAYFLATA